MAQQHAALEGAYVFEKSAPTAVHSLSTLVTQNHLMISLLRFSLGRPVEVLLKILVICQNVIFCLFGVLRQLFCM